MRQFELFFNLVDGTEEIPFSMRNSTFSLPIEVLESTETPSDALPSNEPPAMPAEEAPIESPSIEVVISPSTDQLTAFTPLVLKRSDSDDTVVIEEDPSSDETESDSDSNETVIDGIDQNTLSDGEQLVYIPEKGKIIRIPGKSRIYRIRSEPNLRESVEVGRGEEIIYDPLRRTISRRLFDDDE